MPRTRPRHPRPWERKDRSRPFPMQPLLDVTPGDSAKKKAKALGLDRIQIVRWLDYGLTEAQADELACKVGKHPIDIWPDIWVAEITAATYVRQVVELELARTRRWVFQWMRDNLPTAEAEAA